MQTQNKKLISYFVINLIIILSSAIGISWAVFGGQAINLNSFLYFTNLSNIFVMVIAVIFARKQCKQLKGQKQTYSANLMLFKYIATVAITITFLVYSGLLLPEILVAGDYHKLFTVNNFTLHYITPILTILSFFLFDKNYIPKNKHSFLTIFAPLSYFVFAIVLSLLPGQGFFGSELEPAKFPYFFLNYETNGWFDLSGGIFKLGVFWWVIILFVIISALSYAYILIFRRIHKIKSQPENNKETLTETKKEDNSQEIREEIRAED